MTTRLSELRACMFSMQTSKQGGYNSSAGYCTSTGYCGGTYSTCSQLGLVACGCLCFIAETDVVAEQ